MALQRRLLQDIAELQSKPYPNITLIPREDTISEACLILTPNGGRPLHLTVGFPADYPIQPPSVAIQSMVIHPNVFGTYICASVLNTTEGYTPAYTLKGIAIQLLSFFSSDKLEQDYGGVEDLTQYRDGKRGFFSYDVYDFITITRCSFCQFDSERSRSKRTEKGSTKAVSSLSASTEQLCLAVPSGSIATVAPALPANAATSQSEGRRIPTSLGSMPDEMLVQICNELETEELMIFARAWERIGGEQGIMTKFNLIRKRELLCFCLKQSFEEVKLGVGVQIAMRGRQGTFESEFDLLSLQAFTDFHIRRSVQGLPFEFWLPLPISRRHYSLIHDKIQSSLTKLAQEAHLSSSASADVIYHFMSDVVVKLSTQASEESERSSLSHASEKAIESYYHLFHLLLCLAIEDDSIVRSINRTLQGVLNGRTSKNEIPSLGHLLIAVLISDADMTPDLLMAIIRETVTRNVVWMLDPRGQGMAELSYMEADAISHYRLRKTFEASKTSYRLLMFLNLFRRTINRGTGKAKKTLLQLRDELFDAHGAPPRGTATQLAGDVKRLQEVNSFPKFIAIMGLTAPSASQFTAFLRNCVEDSVRKGYSVWGISQERALTLRRQVDANVQVRADPKPEWSGRGTFQGKFFPDQGGRGGGRSGRGGRGRGGRGGYH